MRTWWVGLAVSALLVAPGAVMAGSDTEGSTLQASMVVSGTIVIKPDGSVASYALDKPDEVAPGALGELTKVVPLWKFQPVMRHGKAVTFKSPMSVRLVAKPADHGNYAVTVSSAYFGKCAPGTCLTWKTHNSPRYPSQMRGLRPANFHGAAYMATVYLMIQVGRDGAAQQVAVRRVDLGVRGSAARMQRWRRDFAKVSVAAAKNWTFNVPVTGLNADKDHWTAITPVVFNLRSYTFRRPHLVRYGQWQSYVPGPRHFIPWANKGLLADGGADAVPAGGGVYSVQQTLHLISSLGGH